MNLSWASWPTHLSAVMLVLFTAPVWGMQWEMSRDVRLGLTYSDNINLVSDGAMSTVTGTVRPQITFNGTGLYSTASARFALEYVRDLDEPNDVVSPSLRLTGESTPGGGPVSLDASAGFYEIAAQGRQTAGDVSSNLDNLTSASDIGLGATYSQNLGTQARFTARYSIAELMVPDLDERDTSSRTAEVSLRRQQGLGSLDWGINATSSRNTVGDDAFIELRNAFIDGSVPVADGLSLSAALGREWVDQPEIDTGDEALNQQLPTLEDQFDFWDIALTWQAGRNTVLTAGYGEHFFGHRPRFELEHSLRNSTVSLFWTRGITRSGTLIQSRPVNPVDNDATDTGVDSVVLPGNGLISDDEQFVVDEQITLSWLLSGRVSSITVEGTRSIQERNGGVIAGGDNADNSESRFTSLRLAFERQLSRSISFQTDYQHTRQDSDREGAEFDENRVGATLTIGF